MQVKYRVPGLGPWSWRWPQRWWPCVGDVQPFTKPLATATPQSMSTGGTGTNQHPCSHPGSRRSCSAPA